MIPRLFTQRPLAPGETVAVDGRAHHYLRNVLRRSAGDALLLFNGRDGEFEAKIVALDRRRAEIAVTRLRRAQEQGLDVMLCFAPLKKDAIDFLIEKGTELGVAAFQPVVTRRTVASRLNLERLSANAIEAAEQCERLTVPEIRAPLDLTALLAGWEPRRHIILCAESGPARPIADAFGALTTDVKRPNAWAIFCGPEGGFHVSELDRLRDLPFVTPVGLGPRILRADTAALAALAVFQAILGDGPLRPSHRATPIGAGADGTE